MMTARFELGPQAEDLFKRRYSAECDRVHQLMMWLMLVQWFAGIGFALFYSPWTWIGEHYEIHIHVWLAALLGGAISGFAVLWIRTFPDAAHTRHVVAAMQVLWSALFIHLTGGRIETHFHAFASIAIISTYRDWKVLITATAIVAVDHLIRGIFYPMSAFGVAVESPFRWVEHSLWLLFEAGFLIPACIRLRNEIGELCVRQTDLEEAKQTVDIQVDRRTNELVLANRRLEEKTKEAEKLALVARYTDNGVMITNADGQIEWVNAGFERITGFTSEQVTGRCSWEFLHGAQTDADEVNRLKAAIANHGAFDGELIKYRRTGEPFWMSVEFRPIRNSDGIVSRYIVIERDISERVAADIERQRLNEQLVDASRNAGIAEMATGVLHNVGNVLNSVNVSASVIRTIFNRSAFNQLDRLANLIDEHQDDYVDFVQNDERGRLTPKYLVKVTEAIRREREKFDVEFGEIVSNIDHIKEIVSVQQESAKTTGLKQLVCPRKVVEDAIIANKGTLTNHHVRIHTEFDDKLSPFTSDKRKILQILINLITNAKDAVVEAAAERPTVELRVARDGNQILFEVTDNGVGIEPELVARVFQHGFTTKAKGHGFGLHSCANAATELGGWMNVTSPGAGKGTTFTLGIPMLDQESEGAAASVKQHHMVTSQVS
ncbi:MAG: two-component system sensor histidine kinase NtrB [Aureliella sp.]